MSVNISNMPFFVMLPTEGDVAVFAAILLFVRLVRIISMTSTRTVGLNRLDSASRTVDVVTRVWGGGSGTGGIIVRANMGGRDTTWGEWLVWVIGRVMLI